MELLMLQDHPTHADSAFVAGIVSVMDALLGQPMQQVVDALGLADDMRAALLQRSGPIGRTLGLVEALEGDDDRAVLAYLDEDERRAAKKLNHSQGLALAWANQVLQAA